LNPGPTDYRDLKKRVLAVVEQETTDTWICALETRRGLVGEVEGVWFFLRLGGGVVRSVRRRIDPDGLTSHRKIELSKEQAQVLRIELEKRHIFELSHQRNFRNSGCPARASPMIDHPPWWYPMGCVSTPSRHSTRRESIES
jgi:hypothetical protein